MTEALAKQILGHLILWGPFLWEVSDDKKGDFNSNKDIVKRAVLMAAVAGVDAWLNSERNYFLSLFTSFAIFFMFFDYVIAYILIKNKTIEVKGAHWFAYLSKVKKLDNWKIWANAKHWQRLTLRACVFILSFFLYFRQ